MGRQVLDKLLEGYFSKTWFEELGWQKSPEHGLQSQADMQLASDFAMYQPCDLGELLSFQSLSFLSCKQEIILNCLPFGENSCDNSAWHAVSTN